MNNVCVPACVFATQALPPPTHKLRGTIDYERAEYMTTDDSSPSFSLIIQTYFHLGRRCMVDDQFYIEILSISLKINNDVIAWLFEIKETQCFRCGTFEEARKEHHVFKKLLLYI